MLDGEKRVPPLGFYRQMAKVETGDAAGTPLLVDVMISPRRDADFDRYQAPPTQLSGPRFFFYQSNHLSEGTLPSGANVLSFDGHVAWRAFDPKKTFVCGTGPANPPTGSPFFWFPEP